MRAPAGRGFSPRARCSRTHVRTHQLSGTPQPLRYLPFILANPRFLAFGFLIAAFSSFGQTFFIGLFGAELRDGFGLSHGEFGTTYSIATVVSALTMVWLGRLIDRLDLRVFTVMVCLVMVAACFVMGAAGSIVVLGLAIYLLRLSGQGLMSHISITAMARYFETGRGKALSLAAMGHPAGEAVLPIVTVGVIALLGWRGTWFLIGGILGVALIPVLLWLLKGHAERHRRHVESRGAGQTRPTSDWALSAVLRDPRFYLIVPGLMAPAFITTGFFFIDARPPPRAAARRR